MKELSLIENFLLRLERNEGEVFTRTPDHVLFPIIPFFQLVHTLNIEQVLIEVGQFESAPDNVLIRVDGYLTLAAEESSVRHDDLRRLTIQLLEAMRY